MKYYRLIFKKENDEILFTEIYEQEVDEKTFNEMRWEKPIMRHFDGKYLHLMSLEKSYLEAIILGFNIANDF